MNRITFRRFTSLAVLTAALAIAPAMAAKGGKAQVINWRMTPTVDNLDARGKLQYKGPAGKAQFSVNVHGLAPGTYSLDINGVSAGTFDVGSHNGGYGGLGTGTGSASGKLRLKQKKGGLPVDPRGAMVTVSAGGTQFLTASFPLTAEDADCEQEVEADLLATGAVVGATGRVEFESEEGESQFEVDVAGLAAGSYDLLVGGVVVGSITVGADGRGHIEFATEVEDEDDDGEGDFDLFLNFDPLGQSVQVAQTGTVILEVTLPAQATCEGDDDDQGDDDDDQGEDGD